MEILVVIATYNERDNIETLVQRVLGLRDDIRVLIVDDNSPDGTGELAEELKRDTGRVEVIHRESKLGLGTAHKAGLRYGMERGSDLVVTMDADHSHAPEYLPDFISRSDRASIVIGSRYTQGGGTRNWELKRKILSRIANIYARIITGLDVKDCTTGYRVYRGDFLDQVDLDAIASTGYSFLVEILLQASRKGFAIEEVPIIFVDRIKGQSKIDLSEIVGGALSLLGARIKNL